MSITDASRLVEIEAEICTIAGVLATSRARLLALVGEFDAADAWVATGHPSCAALARGAARHRAVHGP